MTKTLILMRHAKSSWGDPALDDHARPLNRRGEKSAKALGDWLREHRLEPDETLSSSSVRTRQTFAGLGLSKPATFLVTLYHAEAQRMLSVLHGARGDVVLMIGHNPGIAAFAQALVADPPTHERFMDYPTGATLVAQFDIPGWPSLRWGMGKVRDFVVPRELVEM
ncbi:MAG: histidine phosphatase family protein [Paracoccaceae bacterium]